MEVKPGYKQTEVGVIPEDWDTPELGVILKSMQLGGNYKNSERQTNWPLIKMGNLGRGSIKLDKLEFIDSSQPAAIRDRLEEGDVLFNTRNTLELVGKVAIWRNELSVAFFNSNIMRMEFDRARVSRRFMNYILNTKQSLISLRGIAIGTTSVAAIYSRDLVMLKVPLPTKAEQEAIAEALTDADALIESLEQLIAKKRSVKQGAMQELLTGKKKLPGFSGEWKVVPLGRMIKLQGGYSFLSNDFLDIGVPVIRISDIQGGVVHVDGAICHPPIHLPDDFMIRKGDVLVAMSGATTGKVGLFKYSKPAYQNQRVGKFVVKDKNHTSPGFVRQLVQSSMFVSKLGVFLEQGAQPNISGRQIESLVFAAPRELTEQNAIATILSDMDTEITALETKLAKARQIKLGMMQELLTGRIRLV